MRLTQIPLKELHYPDHYTDGQQPTAAGLVIHLILQDLDFTTQLKGGPNAAFKPNPLLFKSPEDYWVSKSKL